MPDRLKDTGQTKCIPWSSRLGVGHQDKDPTPEKFYQTMEAAKIQGCGASKDKVSSNDTTDD
jgi:hypothetical protein